MLKALRLPVGDFALSIKIIPLREQDVPKATDLVVEGREWSVKTDTFVPALAVLGHPDSRWYSAVTAEGELVGVIGYHGINWIDGTGEMFTSLTLQHRKKALFEPLVRRQLDVGFKELGLRRIVMTTLEGSPSAKMADKLGIRKEGIFPAARLKNGTYPTALAYGVTRGEYYV